MSQNPSTRVMTHPADTYHGLTSLRFFAAFYVVLYHSLVPLVASTRQHASLLRAVSLGYASVSFFFFLSGYILSIAYLKTGRDLQMKERFYTARFARIYPIFLLTLLLDIPDWFVAHARSFGGYLSACIPTSAVLVEHLLLLQAWFPWQRGIDRPNWSLSVEAFFYLLFPFIGVVIWRRSSRGIALLTLMLWIGGQFLVCIGGRYLSVDALMFVPIFHLSTFMLGIALARWQYLHASRVEAFSMTVMISIVAVAALAVAPFFFWPSFVAKQYLNDGLLAPVFAGIILLVSMKHRLPARLLGNSVLRELGHASYALYLLHFPILHLMERLPLPRTWTFYCLYLALCIGLSLLSLNFIEIPWRLRIVNWSLSRERKVLLRPTQT